MTIDAEKCSKMEQEIHDIKTEVHHMDREVDANRLSLVELKTLYENDPARKFFAKYAIPLAGTIILTLLTAIYNLGSAASTQTQLEKDQDSYISVDTYNGHKAVSEQRFKHLTDEVEEVQTLLKEQNTGIHELLRRIPK